MKDPGLVGLFVVFGSADREIETDAPGVLPLGQGDGALSCQLLAILASFERGGKRRALNTHRVRREQGIGGGARVEAFHSDRASTGRQQEHEAKKTPGPASDTL